MYRNNQSELGAFLNNFRQFLTQKAPIFPVFLLNIGKNTSNSFLKKSIDRKHFSSSNDLSYAKMFQKNAWASLLQFAGVTMPHLPHVLSEKNFCDRRWTDGRTDVLL